MKLTKRLLTSALILGVAGVGAYSASGQVSPAEVEASIELGGSIEIAKTVTLLNLPADIDVCFLEDETGSFADDVGVLQGGVDEIIYDSIIAESPSAQFAVAGFRDYPESPYGTTGDYVYHLLSAMNPSKAAWIAGIDSLSAFGGSDLPEAQYDAIVAAAGPGSFIDPTLGLQANCGWRDQPESGSKIQRVLIVATDATFHTPDGTHQNDQSATITALNGQDIMLIGLKAPGAGTELDALAVATGGSVQPIDGGGTNIADAIMAGLDDVITDVWPVVNECDPGLSVSLDPLVRYEVPSGTSVNFIETIAVANDPALAGQDLECAVDFYANDYPETGTLIGRETILIHVPAGENNDLTIACVATVNPHGQKIPPAGSSTMPGAKGGINEDGFYELIANDESDENLKIWISDEFGSGPFGPYYSGDKVKITESPGAKPSVKKIGSAKGQGGAILSHITLKGDAIISTTDSAGNTAEATCYVPPIPK